MTFTRPKTTDFKQVVCTIGGQLIGGYGTDGGLEYEWADDIGEDDIGADGEVTFARSNDARLYVDITLRQNSAGYARVMALAEAQRQQRPEIGPLPYEAFNPATGERVSSSYCIFKTRPTPNEQKATQDRTIRVLLPHPKHVPPAVA